jgi:hypothetical protein
MKTNSADASYKKETRPHRNATVTSRAQLRAYYAPFQDGQGRLKNRNLVNKKFLPTAYQLDTEPLDDVFQ